MYIIVGSSPIVPVACKYLNRGLFSKLYMYTHVE